VLRPTDAPSVTISGNLALQVATLVLVFAVARVRVAGRARIRRGASCVQPTMGVFHEGERAAQARAGVEAESRHLGRGISCAIPEGVEPFLEAQRIVVLSGRGSPPGLPQSPARSPAPERTHVSRHSRTEARMMRCHARASASSDVRGLPDVRAVL
jgi:hypothetical protein